MTKLEFPANYNLLGKCTDEHTMVGRFYDTNSGANVGVIDVEITEPKYYRAYSTDEEPKDYNLEYSSLRSDIMLWRDSALPLSADYSNNWNIVNKHGIDIWRTLGDSPYTLYILDEKGNIITSMYNESTYKTYPKEISFSGFKVYVRYDNYIYRSLLDYRISITYEGSPDKANSFNGYFVAVIEDSRGVEYNTYYCIKLTLINEVRILKYPTSEAFMYSMDTPTFAENMLWQIIDNPVNIAVDADGKIKVDDEKQDSINISISKFQNLENPVTVNNSLECVKTTEDNWITIDSLKILDIKSFKFTMTANSGAFRQQVIYINDKEQLSDTILKIVISQDAAPTPEDWEDKEYYHYTAYYKGDSTELPLPENTSMQLYINKAGNGIDTYLPETSTDDYTIELVKRKHVPNTSTDSVQEFIPNVEISDKSVVDYMLDDDNPRLIRIFPVDFILYGESKDATITIKDGNVTLLSIKVSQRAESTKEIYCLYGKKTQADSWELYANSEERYDAYEEFEKNWYGGDVTDEPNPEDRDKSRKPEIRYYKLVCEDNNIQLDVDSVKFDLSQKPQIVVTTEIEPLEKTQEEGSTENSIVFKVTYTVTSENSSHSSDVKIIYLSYDKYITHRIDFLQGGRPYDAMDYNPDGEGYAKSEDAIWSGADYVQCTDTGEGEVVDPTSLLYKGSTSNIYRTIEAKDTRLFLGNYKTPEQENNIKEAGINIFKDLEVKKGWHHEDLIGSISNIITKQNSDDIRIMKKGEYYLLGLVFVYKTGQTSDVYVLEKNPDEESGYYSVSEQFRAKENSSIQGKAFFYIPLSNDILGDLNRAGIAAVIPVRAVNTSFNTIAQGFALPTIQIDERMQDNRTIYLYPYRFATSQDKFSIDTDVQIAGISFSKNKKLVAVNTPEMDCSEDMTLSSFNCNFNTAEITSFGDVNVKFESLDFTVDNVYRHSYGPINFTQWFGFADFNESNFLSPSENTNHYGFFDIYIWNREILAGEPPTAKFKKKVFVFNGGTAIINPDFNNLINKVTCYTYRNYDYTELKSIGNSLYQGNVDYSISKQTGYTVSFMKIGASKYDIVKASYDTSFTNTLESGIDTNGKCYAPVWMRYKATPHLIADLGDKELENPSIVELTNVESVTRDKISRPYLQWIKCGPMVCTSINTARPLKFLSGDFFFGKYECLRTYPYSTSDPNSLVEVYSAYLASRVNLNLRADINVGIVASYLNPTNFNIFNPVYNQENNFFTYTYKGDNISYNRNFSNTILWSLNKVYGSMIDEWCHILNINSLDLDGDKGGLTSIEKFNGSLIAFQTTGISQILFNDNVQVSTNNGVPIEMKNSGTVEGRRYLQDRIGCQNRLSIVNSPKYLYFIDSINKGIYTLDNQGSVTDITYAKGMKSWALKNLTKDWWGYYDIYSLEVLFADSNNCIAYNDMLEYFPCFLSYENVKHSLSLNGRTYLFNNKSGTNTLWKKNAIQSNSIFGSKVPIEVEMVVNPEPTEDKTFETIEYRADGFYYYNSPDLFSNDNRYNPTASFDTIRVSNEYQDTTDIILDKSADGNTYAPNSNTQKKFRIWRIQIPRAKYYNYSNGLYGDSMDRIRNSWCKIKLSTNMTDYDKFIVHDFMVKYYK